MFGLHRCRHAKEVPTHVDRRTIATNGLNNARFQAKKRQIPMQGRHRPVIHARPVFNSACKFCALESVIVESVIVESVIVESVIVESVIVESVIVESVIVESVIVESVIVESVIVESVIVESAIAWSP